MSIASDKQRALLSLVRDEALAYLKLGLLAPMRRHIVEDIANDSNLGILFVPGVGANGAQFLALKDRLRDHACCFDSFEYRSFDDLRETARKLRDHIVGLRGRAHSILLVTHSLGGVLGRLVLQADDPPPEVLGFVAICAPLHGTWRSKMAPHPRLRALAPDQPLMAEIAATAYRLERFGDRILTIGTETDQFVKPSSSAFLDGFPKVLLDGVAHAGSLFDPRVASAVTELAARLVASAHIFREWHFTSAATCSR